MSTWSCPRRQRSAKRAVEAAPTAASRAQPASAVVARLARRVGLGREAHRARAVRWKHIERVGEDVLRLPPAYIRAVSTSRPPAATKLRSISAAHGASTTDDACDQPNVIVPGPGGRRRPRRAPRSSSAAGVTASHARLTSSSTRPAASAGLALRRPARRRPELAHARRRQRRLDRAPSSARCDRCRTRRQSSPMSGRGTVRRKVGQRAPDLAVRAVVPHDEEQRQLLLRRHRQLLHAHLQPAVADDRHDRPAVAVEPAADRGADGRGQAVAERRRADRVEEGVGCVRRVEESAV